MKKKLQNLIFSLLLIAVAVFLLIWRAPQLIAHPRFWAEDGFVYFSYAYHNPVFQSLIYPQLGYYSLLVNAVSVISARLVSLSNAPLLATMVAFLVQLIPVSIVVFGKARLWDKFWKKFIVILIIIFIRPSAEIWLTLVSAQYHLALATVFVLIESSEKDSKLQIILTRVLLIIAGLNGVVSAILAPVFLLKYYFYRRKENLIQSIILFVALAIQLLVYVYLQINNLVANRNFSFSFREFGLISINKNFLNLFWSKNYVLAFANFVSSIYPNDFQMTRIILTVFFLLIAVVLFVIFRLSEDKKFLCLLYCSLFITWSLSYLMAWGDKLSMAVNSAAGGRYFYVQNTLILLIIFSFVSYGSYKKETLIKIFFSVALIVAIYFGWSEFHQSDLLKQNVPDWKMQIKIWQNDHSYQLQVWPKGEIMQL